MPNASTVARVKGLIEGMIPPIIMPYCKRFVRMTPYARGRLVHGPRTTEPSQPKALEAAWEHVLQIDSLPRSELLPATTRWEFFLRRTRDEMCFFSSPAEATRFAQRKIDFEHREAVTICRHLFDLHVATIRSEFPNHSFIMDRLSDSELSAPDTVLQCGKRLISNVFFWHMRTLLQAITKVKELSIVGEIGSGYGALARYFLNTPETKVQTFCLMDFPECLFFAEVFLRASFPDLPIYYVASPNPVDPQEIAKYRLVLCPLQNLSALAKVPFNLIINTGSMQEMTEEWIDYWMQWLATQPCRFFYSMNYFGQALDFMAEGGNTWSPRLTKEWVTRYQHYDPPFVRQQSDRNFAEIVAEKAPDQIGASISPQFRYSALQNRAMSNSTLLEAMDIVRVEENGEIMWDILERVAKEMPFVPKEAYYLASRLRQKMPKTFGPDQRQAVEAMFARLDRIRKGGVESGHAI